MSYAIILSLSFIIPFIFSFEKKICFISKLKKLLTTILIVSSVYIIWDIIFTAKGIWDFSDKETLGLKLVNLPLEEFLFFIIIPYCLIFIYEVINFYSADRQIHIKKVHFYLMSFILFLVGLIFYEKIYTFMQFILISIILIIIALNREKIYLTKNLIIYLIISFIPFLIVNFFLTSIPIVVYNGDEIIGLRILTIPIEDFFYHLSYAFLLAEIYRRV